MAICIVQFDWKILRVIFNNRSKWSRYLIRWQKWRKVSTAIFIRGRSNQLRSRRLFHIYFFLKQRNNKKIISNKIQCFERVSFFFIIKNYSWIIRFQTHTKKNKNIVRISLWFETSSSMKKKRARVVTKWAVAVLSYEDAHGIQMDVWEQIKHKSW